MPADTASEYDETKIESFAGRRAAAIKRYGLIGVTVQNWSGTDGKVRLTLYEMIDATAAYGLFSLDRIADQPRAVSIPFGSEGYQVGGRLSFWQSKYVVRLDGNATALNRSEERRVGKECRSRWWQYQ